jgi:BON domain
VEKSLVDLTQPNDLVVQKVSRVPRSIEATLLRPMPSHAFSAALKSFRFATSILAVLALASCTMLDAYQKCGWSGCPGDAQITAAVQVQIRTHPALRPPDDIGVQTLDHVVYLSGLVDTDREKDIAEAAARGVPGVTRVVNSISVRNQVH